MTVITEMCTRERRSCTVHSLMAMGYAERVSAGYSIMNESVNVAHFMCSYVPTDLGCCTIVWRKHEIRCPIEHSKLVSNSHRPIHGILRRGRQSSVDKGSLNAGLCWM